ncbi:diacylglycerol kinase family lipid kinase [Paenibacillus sp. TRM 82003]|nr:diacylglycerol kinase family lipid kinase [Paenibacillus sp. TRM 82003]
MNAFSGNGRGRRAWRQVESALREGGISYRVSFTEAPGHATALAVRYARSGEATAVVAVGGDGTASETAAGLVGTGVPLGFIAAGSGNDFARGLGLSTEPLEALQTILSGRRVTIDVARYGDRYFLNSFGAGFDGVVAQAINASIAKRWFNRFGLGKLSYAFVVLTSFASFRPVRLTVEIDEELHSFRDVWMVVAANMPYYGGGMMICPAALPDDGRFQICVVHSLSRPQLLRYFPSIYRGDHIRLPYVTMLTGSRMVVRSEDRVAAHADGEPVEFRAADIAVIPNGIEVFVPTITP